MGPNTRIYHRFTGYTVQDCSCEYCLYYGGKRRGCMVESCCCLKERLQALAREYRVKEETATMEDVRKSIRSKKAKER